jgi:hypothetical protein
MNHPELPLSCPPPARRVLEPPSDFLLVRRTILSADRFYRYTLWRQWGQGTSYAMFIGLNPSTADENVNDPTIRKCIGFARRWGFDALCMTNLFAFRATEPRKMKGHSKPIGDENDRWLVAAAREASVIVAAWGVNGQFMGRDEEVLKLLDDVQCLRTTKDGHPEHPLYVPYDTPLKPYSIRTVLEPTRASGTGGPLSPPSPPIKTAGEPLPGAKTPPSGGGLTLRGPISKSLDAGAVRKVPLRGPISRSLLRGPFVKVPSREGRSRIETNKAGGSPQSLPGVPPALTARLLPILKRAGYVVPGHPAWRSPAELEGWFAAPREELGGRAWAEVHVPFTLEARMRFAHAMDQIDRESVEVPA